MASSRILFDDDDDSMALLVYSPTVRLVNYDNIRDQGDARSTEACRAG